MAPTRPTGSVRMRSNIVFDRARLDLVPGEVLDAATRARRGTPRQLREHMYYALCSVCDRTIMEINLDGCERCVHAPPPVAVAAARESNADLVARARDEETRENERLHEDRRRRLRGVGA